LFDLLLTAMYYKPAADQNFVEAQYNDNAFFPGGEGIGIDFVTEVRLYNPSADQNSMYFDERNS
jgi:hypothetical protein